MGPGSLFRRRRTLFLIQLPLGLLSITVLLWRVDLRGALRRLPLIDLRWVLPGLLAFTCSKLIHTYRWLVLLWQRKNLHLGPLFAIFLTSNFANSLLFLHAGDLLRIELPRHRFASRAPSWPAA